jgi:hypothetical protein
MAAEDYLLADFCSHVLAWRLTQAPFRGVAGRDCAALGIPTERVSVRACRRRTGRASAGAGAAATGARPRTIADAASGQVARIGAARNA